MTPETGTARRTCTIVHTEASLGWGGQERRIVAEAQIMGQRGHTVIVAADPRGELYQRGVAAGLDVFPCRFGGRDNITAVFILRRLLQRRRVDILNTHSSLDSWVGLFAVLGRRSRTDLVRTRHLSTPIRTSWPTRYLYRRPEAVITTGEAIRSLIMSRAEVPAARIFSIPTGVPLERFAPRPPGDRTGLPAHWPPEAVLIGAVAVLRSWKGHLYLVEALAELVRAGDMAYLVLVGDGPYRVVIEARVAELNLGEYVFFAGYQDDVPDWLARLDIVVLASYANEGVPQSLLQAMAMAKPVVGTTCGGMPEIITPGVNGLLVPPRASGALAAALLRLIEHPGERQEFGRQGRALVVARYSLEQMAAATEKVYDLIQQRQS